MSHANRFLTRLVIAITNDRHQNLFEIFRIHVNVSDDDNKFSQRNNHFRKKMDANIAITQLIYWLVAFVLVIR